jgi:hypothetical protein
MGVAEGDGGLYDVGDNEGNEGDGGLYDNNTGVTEFDLDDDDDGPRPNSRISRQTSRGNSALYDVGGGIALFDTGDQLGNSNALYDVSDGFAAPAPTRLSMASSDGGATSIMDVLSGVQALRRNVGYGDVGKRVTVDQYGAGVIRFYGPHVMDGRPRVGVELDMPVGLNNGTVGVRSFPFSLTLTLLCLVFSCSSLTPRVTSTLIARPSAVCWWTPAL